MKPFAANGAFRSDTHESDALRSFAVRGAGITVLAGGLGQAIQIIATVILARLLTPEDFGVVAMVTTLSLLLSNFGFNGFTEAVVQREEIDHSLISNLFWVNLGVGLLLTIGFAAAGPILARFYSNPHVTTVAAAISLTILFTSSSVLHLALLKRAMRFSVVCANDIAARAVSVFAAILFAWAGCGYWALVAGVVAQALSTSVGAFMLCRWVPGLPRPVAGTLSMVQFALHVYGRFSVNYGSRNMGHLLVGWHSNAQALGFYKKAYDLFALCGSLLVSSLTVVAVSALSRVKKDSVQYRRYLLSALAVTAFVGMGIGGAVTLIGKDLIRLLLGPGWEPAGQIFTLFGPGIGIMFLYGTHSWIHLSIGRPDRWLRWGFVEFVFTSLLFLLALPRGVVAIAAAWTATLWILTIPALWYAVIPIHLGIGPILAVVWKYIIASLLAAWACLQITQAVHPFVGLPAAVSALARIGATSFLFMILYGAAVIMLHRGFAPLRRLAGLLVDMGLWGRFSTLQRVLSSNPKSPTPASITTE